MSLPSLLLALTLSAPYEHESLVPAYIPRAVVVGTYVGYATTPQIRLQWEITLVQAARDAFVLMFEGGGGYGLSMPTGFGSTGGDAMTFLYQHTLLGGVAYRAEYSGGFAWGFHVATGPVFYGDRIQNAPTENTVNGWVEGGGQAGIRVNGITYGLAFRYAALYNESINSQGGPFVGGFFLGLYLDWR